MLVFHTLTRPACGCFFALALMACKRLDRKSSVHGIPDCGVNYSSPILSPLRSLIPFFFHLQDIFPVVLTVVIAFSIFFADPTDLEIRLATVITLFLALVALQFTVMDQVRHAGQPRQTWLFCKSCAVGSLSFPWLSAGDLRMILSSHLFGTLCLTLSMLSSLLLQCSLHAHHLTS